MRINREKYSALPWVIVERNEESSAEPGQELWEETRHVEGTSQDSNESTSGHQESGEKEAEFQFQKIEIVISDNEPAASQPEKRTTQMNCWVIDHRGETSEDDSSEDESQVLSKETKLEMKGNSQDSKESTSGRQELGEEKEEIPNLEVFIPDLNPQLEDEGTYSIEVPVTVREAGEWAQQEEIMEAGRQWAQEEIREAMEARQWYSESVPNEMISQEDLVCEPDIDKPNIFDLLDQILQDDALLNLPEDVAGDDYERPEDIWEQLDGNYQDFAPNTLMEPVQDLNALESYEPTEEILQVSSYQPLVQELPLAQELPEQAHPEEPAQVQELPPAQELPPTQELPARAQPEEPAQVQELPLVEELPAQAQPEEPAQVQELPPVQEVPAQAQPKEPVQVQELPLAEKLPARAQPEEPAQVQELPPVQEVPMQVQPEEPAQVQELPLAQELPARAQPAEPAQVQEAMAALLEALPNLDDFEGFESDGSNERAARPPGQEPGREVGLPIKKRPRREPVSPSALERLRRRSREMRMEFMGIPTKHHLPDTPPTSDDD